MSLNRRVFLAGAAGVSMAGAASAAILAPGASASEARALESIAADLDAIAAGEREVEALKGWRFQAFGDDALRLCKGEIALTAKGNDVKVIRL